MPLRVPVAELHSAPVYGQLHWRWNYYGIAAPHIVASLLPPLALMGTSIIAEEWFGRETSMVWALLSFIPIMTFVSVVQWKKEPEFLRRRFMKRCERRWTFGPKGVPMPPFPVRRADLE